MSQIKTNVDTFPQRWLLLQVKNCRSSCQLNILQQTHKPLPKQILEVSHFGRSPSTHGEFPAAGSDSVGSPPPEIQTQRFLAPTCFPGPSLRCSSWAARSSPGRAGGLAGSSGFQSKRHRAGMYARTHARTRRNPEVLLHTHICTLPTLALYPRFIFSCLSLNSRATQAQCTAGI